MASTSAKFGFIKGSPIIDVAELPNPVTKSAINPTGSYDKISFNTSLSKDEVINILEKITYSDTSQGISGYAIIAWNDEIEGDIALVIGDYGQAFGLSRNLVIGYLDTFIFAENAFPQIGINTAGWQEFDNPLELSITGILDEGNPDDIGLQNELLKDLVYVEEVNENAINTKALYRLPDGTLWHYNGQWNAVGSGNKTFEIDFNAGDVTDSVDSSNTHTLTYNDSLKAKINNVLNEIQNIKQPININACVQVYTDENKTSENAFVYNLPMYYAKELIGDGLTAILFKAWGDILFTIISIGREAISTNEDDLAMALQYYGMKLTISIA